MPPTNRSASDRTANSFPTIPPGSMALSKPKECHDVCITLCCATPPSAAHGHDDRSALLQRPYVLDLLLRRCTRDGLLDAEGPGDGDVAGAGRERGQQAQLHVALVLVATRESQLHAERLEAWALRVLDAETLEGVFAAG